MKPQKALDVDSQYFAYEFFNYDTNLYMIFVEAIEYCFGHIPLIKELKLTDESPKYETKNDAWFVLEVDEVQYLIRKHSTHFTVYIFKPKDIFSQKLFIFEFFVDSSEKYKFHESQNLKYDECDYFSEFNDFLALVHKSILKGSWNLALWNDYGFPKPSYTRAKKAMSGKEYICSIDLTYFAIQEVFQLHLELYAQNDTLNLLKKLKADGVTELNGHKIRSIVVKDKHYDGKYYHGIGIKTESGKFHDIYDLSRPDCNVLYPEEKYITKKSFRVTTDSGVVGYATHPQMFMPNVFNIDGVDYYTSTDSLEVLIKALSYNVMCDNVEIKIEKKRVYDEYDGIFAR